MAENPMKIKIEISVTDEDIDDIMCCALEGGITYWCCEARVVGKYLGEWGHEQIARGGRLILCDSESDDRWVLTKKKLLSGIKKWLESGEGVRAIEDGKLDCGMIDACDADLIVQYGVFGEIVFG